ncbi:uncharacterized protein LOC105699627 [Orussus abietinus]|uniref:uncharacterized protein LOC105699627 n=1 Tax=Orussus abietinus TaxID=222816 RepID=UPI000625D80F|nr:uncharacterized protein LOC105699627 [Orussus abietinus]
MCCSRLCAKVNERCRFEIALVLIHDSGPRQIKNIQLAIQKTSSLNYKVFYDQTVKPNLRQMHRCEMQQGRNCIPRISSNYSPGFFKRIPPRSATLMPLLGYLN